LKQRPAQMEMIKLAERWRPWRGVAAHVLWNYYRAVKKRDAIPLQASGTKNG
jgi:DNA-3-methyladenine glycosylase II